MIRFVQRTSVALVAIAVLAGSALAQNLPRNTKELEQQVGITSEQLKKMDAIGLKYQPKLNAVTEKYRPEFNAIQQQMAPLQQKAISIQQKMNAEARPLVEAGSKEQDAVLTPAQLQIIKDLTSKIKAPTPEARPGIVQGTRNVLFARNVGQGQLTPAMMQVRQKFKLTEAQYKKLEGIDKKYQPKLNAIITKYRPQFTPLQKQMEPLQKKLLALDQKVRAEAAPTFAAMNKEKEAIMTPAQRKKMQDIKAKLDARNKAMLKQMQAQQKGK